MCFQLSHSGRPARHRLAYVLRHGHSKDAREAEYLREAENLLDLLQLVSGHDNLISRHEVERVGSLTFVDGRDVDGKLGQVSIGLPPQHDDLALVARAQHTASFSNRFCDRHTMTHQSNAWLADVADDAVAVGRCFFERDCYLR